MEISAARIAELEWANYAATLPSSKVTPSLDVVLREDMILTRSTAFPTEDSNHACLLRTTPESADDLIGEIRGFFEPEGLPVAVYLSPACVPTDLGDKLVEQGFSEQPGTETWMVLEDLPNFHIPSPYSGITVRKIGGEEALLFSEVFLTAFGMPSRFAPVLAELMAPSVGLPNAFHYVAFQDSDPVGTCSLLSHEDFGVLGSAGVLPEHRRGGAATNLAIRAVGDARARGIETVMLQTTAGTWLERLLRISGFRPVFARKCYTRDHDTSGQD